MSSDSGLKLHKDRMKREGRFDAMTDCAKKIQKTEGQPWCKAIQTAQKRFGFESKAKELEYMKCLAPPPRFKPDQALVDAIAALPARAEAQTEIDWVRTHPLMGETPTSSTPTLLEAGDVLSPYNGPAPSQWAVNMLRHFVNNQAKFFETAIGRDKAMTDSQKPGQRAAAAPVNGFSDNRLDAFEKSFAT